MCSVQTGRSLEELRFCSLSVRSLVNLFLLLLARDRVPVVVGCSMFGKHACHPARISVEEMARAVCHVCRCYPLNRIHLSFRAGIILYRTFFNLFFWKEPTRCVSCWRTYHTGTVLSIKYDTVPGYCIIQISSTDAVLSWLLHKQLYSSRVLKKQEDNVMISQASGLLLFIFIK